MPWDSFRKKRTSDASTASKRKDQQQADHVQEQSQSASSSQQNVQNAANKVRRNQNQNQVPQQQKIANASPRTGGLSQEVYQKIKEVDQETSTLTATGLEGLSARNIDKYEYQQPMPDGTFQTFLCQTVEIIKRPGQSLGLYLREGNDADRADGVFVSRLAEGFDLQKSGVLSTGDEVLTVNNVNVTQMSIDEVVVMISIPRRLLLRTKTLKMRNGSVGFDQHIAKPADNKPIAILKQLPREESRESSLTDDGTPLAGSQLMATAQTSLGVRARQQEGYLSDSTTAAPSASVSTRVPTSAPFRQPAQQDVATASSSNTLRSQNRPHAPPQRSASDRWSYNRQLAMHTPRVLDAEGRPLATGNGDADHPGNPTDSNPGHDAWQSTAYGPGNPHGRPMDPSVFQSTLANTAYLPPPRLQSHLQTMDGGASGAYSGDPFPPAGPSNWSVQVNADPQASMFSPRSVASDPATKCGYSMGGAQPRSVLRQPSAFPTAFPSVKSNSLPRRQPGRTIKWRSDVAASGMEAAAMNSAVAAGLYPSDMSDSDGAVSAPELPLSPIGGGMVPQPVYPIPRMPPTTPSGKTVDEVFSRAEYQAWMRSSGQNFGGRTHYYHQPGVDGGDLYGQQHQPLYASMSSQPHRGYSAVGVGGERMSRPRVPYYATPAEMALGGQQLQQTDYWRQDEGDQMYGGRPAVQTRNRAIKNRSSSLPPRGVLNQGSAMSGRVDTGYYDSPTSGAVSAQMNAAGYVLDVSPLPHRRLPLSLAAASPAFGYTADGPPASAMGNSPNMPTSLTGVLVLRVIDGRGVRARDPEELYCVIEVDGEHRARTEVSDWQAGFRWNETFEIDVWECRQADFYVYSWHPQYRHKLRHRGSLQLLDALLANCKLDNNGCIGSPTSTGQSNHSIALSLDPRGQLFIQIGFQSMAVAYRRMLATRRSAYWAMALQVLAERENVSAGGSGSGVPTVVRRLVQEIERRGVDTTGLYVLCGSSEKKRVLRYDLEAEPSLADVSPDTVPDLNILTSVLKDFFRELPEPLVPNTTFRLLLDAWKVCIPNDKEGNARLMLSVIDLLPKANKCTFMVLMDHLKYVISQSPHNGLSSTKTSTIFGPLVFCTSQAYPITASSDTNGGISYNAAKPYFSFLDHRLAARLLEVLLELWPSPRSSSESSGSENSTINLTSNGSTSLVDLWLQENRLPESNC